MVSNKPNKDSLIEWDSIFNTISDSITIHDVDFNIIKANKAAVKILGKSMKDILRNKCFRSYHCTECAPENCPSCNVLKTKQETNSEVYEPTLGKFLEIKALPRFNQNNKLIGLVHIVRDITERKKAEKELKNKLHDLEVFYKSTVGRELKMKKLKEQINELKAKLKNKGNRKKEK